jgi:hypothetical protein
MFTKEELVKRHELVAAFLDKTLAGDVGLTGYYVENDLPSSPIWPVHFVLKNVGNRALTGTYYALPWGQQLALSGKAVDTLLGARLQIQVGPGVDLLGQKVPARNNTFLFTVQWDGVTSERPFAPILRGDVSRYRAEWKAGEPAFTGILSAHSNGNEFDLFLDSPERQASFHAAVDQLLRAGTTFESRLPYGADTTSPRSIKLEAKSDGGDVTGATYKARQGLAEPPTVVKRSDQDGLVKFEIEEQGLKAGNVSPGKLVLWALPMPEGVLLVGFDTYAAWNPPRLNAIPGYWAPTAH